ncbi:hypothetical protein BC831DRAFT_482909 [Entophlyctis helioformis]|nr:hypothetical protein BC831DRAFT_482909 [Entophlyctis helioformis]
MRRPGIGHHDRGSRSAGSAGITIHGLGAAIHRASDLALAVQRASPVPLSLHITTSSVTLVDDVLDASDAENPDNADDDDDNNSGADDDGHVQRPRGHPSTQTRTNSAIHIRLRPDAAPAASAPAGSTLEQAEPQVRQKQGEA